jgi:hypothetical protein
MHRCVPWTTHKHRQYNTPRPGVDTKFGTTVVNRPRTAGLCRQYNELGWCETPEGGETRLARARQIRATAAHSSATLPPCRPPERTRRRRGDVPLGQRPCRSDEDGRRGTSTVTRGEGLGGHSTRFGRQRPPISSRG